MIGFTAHPSALVFVLALLVALALDRWWGEPPARLHPVVWMGNALGRVGAWVQRHAVQQPGTKDLLAFWLAAIVWIALAALVFGVSWALQSLLLTLPWWGAGMLLGLLLKPLLAWTMLKSEVQAVEVALGQSLDAGRARLRWLVSRDVSQLTNTQVRESAIETLAENLSDSVVAPLFWFVLLGLPGAALYRFANTADAMWGYPGVYQGRNWEWAGKWAARADDVLSWLPARLTALLIALPTAGRGWSAVVANAGLTPSPNGGWPMGALAVGLGIRLGKPGVYTLNAQGLAPLAADTDLALHRCGQVVTMLAVAAAVTAAVVVAGGLA